MALSNEDYKDVKREMGCKTAKKVSRATNDAKNKAIHAKMDPQAKEDKALASSLKRYTEKVKGVSNTRRILG